MSSLLDNLLYYSSDTRLWITGIKDSFSGEFNTNDATFNDYYTIYIEADAFLGCSTLTKVVLSEKVALVNTNAFKNCTKLTEVTINSSNTVIEHGAFTGCTSLTKLYGIYFSSDTKLTALGQLFGGISAEDNSSVVPKSLTELSINNTGTDGGLTRYCCYNCSSLQTVCLTNKPSASNNYIYIPVGAFAGCVNLNSFTCGDTEGIEGVLDISLFSKIDKDAFYGCLAIDTIYYKKDEGQADIQICTDAFKNCTNLFRIYTNFTKFKIGSTRYGHIALAAQFIAPVPASINDITKIANGSFTHDKICYYFSLDDSSIDNGTLTLSDDNMDIHLINNFGANNDKIKHLIIGSSVKLIGTGCFSGCTNLTTVTIRSAEEPKSSKSIAKSAETEKIIFGANTFSNCPQLTTLEISSLNSWLAHTFVYPQAIWTNISTFICGGSKITDGKLELVTSDEALVIIPECAFMHAHFITEFKAVSKEDNTKVGQIDKVLAYAFYDCKNLQSIVGFNDLTYLHETAFDNCGYHVGEGMITLSGIVFGPIDKNTESCVIDPAIHTKFMNNAFKDCNNLKYIYFLGSLADWAQLDFMGAYANPLYQEDCSGDNRVLYLNCKYLPNNEISGTPWNYKLTSTDLVYNSTMAAKKYTFCGVHIAELDFGFIHNTELTQTFGEIFKDALIDNITCSSEIIRQLGGSASTNHLRIIQVKQIHVISNQLLDQLPDYAFKDCNSLETVILNKNIQVFGTNAFESCSALTTCIYEGNLVGETSWSTIVFKSRLSNPLHLNNTKQQVSLITSDYSKNTDVSQLAAIKGFDTASLLPFTFLNFKKLRSFSFSAANLNKFSIDAFYNCPALREIIPIETDASAHKSFHAVTKYNENSVPQGAYIVAIKTNTVVFATAGNYSIDLYAKNFDKQAFNHSKHIEGLTIGNEVQNIPFGLLSNCLQLSYLSLPFLGPSADCASFTTVAEKSEYYLQQHYLGFIFGIPIYVSKNNPQTVYQSISHDSSSMNFSSRTAANFTLVLTGENLRLINNCFYNCNFITNFYISGSIDFKYKPIIAGSDSSLDIDTYTNRWLAINSNKQVAEMTRVTQGLFSGIAKSPDDNTITVLTAVNKPANQNIELRHIEIPNTIKYIYTDAFKDWSHLRSDRRIPLEVICPQSLEFIGNNALANCKFESLHLPNIAYLHKNAFKNSSCTKLYLGAYICLDDNEKINMQVREAISNLYSISIATLPIKLTSILKNSQNFVTEVAFNNSGIIEDNAFYEFKNLTKVALTSDFTGKMTTILKIGKNAFYNCLNLMTFPWDAITLDCTHIEQNAFFNCKQLKTIRLPYALNPLQYNEQKCVMSKNAKSYTLVIPKTGKYRIISKDLVATYINLSAGDSQEQDLNGSDELLAGTEIRLNLRLRVTSAVELPIRYITDTSFYLVLLGQSEILNVSVYRDLTNLDPETWEICGVKNIITEEASTVSTIETTVLPKYTEVSINFYVADLVTDNTSTATTVTAFVPCQVDSENCNIGKEVFKNCNGIIEVLNDAAFDLTLGATTFGHAVANAFSIINTRATLSPTTNIFYYQDFVYLFDARTFETVLIRYNNYSTDNKAVVIPSVINKIKTGVFNEYHNLVSLTADHLIHLETGAISNCPALKTITLKRPGNLAQDAIVGCPVLTKINLGTRDYDSAGLDRLTFSANPFGNHLAEIVLPTTNDKSFSIKTITSTGATIKGLFKKHINSPLYELITVWGPLDKVSISRLEFNTNDGASLIIGDGACKNLPCTVNELIIGDNVTQIGTGAFMRTPISSLSLATKLEVKLEVIKNFAFAECGISKITGNLISTDTDEVANWPQNDPILNIGICAFANNNISGDLYLNKAVKQIGNFAFELNAISTLHAYDKNQVTEKTYPCAKNPSPKLGVEKDWYNVIYQIK